jgi:hypothetical protein
VIVIDLLQCCVGLHAGLPPLPINFGCAAQETASKQLTLEHVLPQKVAPGSSWAQAFSEEEQERWTHRLGNLVLLSATKNSKAGTLDFQKKKSTYFRKGASSDFNNIPLTDAILEKGARLGLAARRMRVHARSLAALPLPTVLGSALCRVVDAQGDPGAAAGDPGPGQELLEAVLVE